MCAALSGGGRPREHQRFLGPQAWWDPLKHRASHNATLTQQPGLPSLQSPETVWPLQTETSIPRVPGRENGKCSLHCLGITWQFRPTPHSPLQKIQSKNLKHDVLWSKTLRRLLEWARFPNCLSGPRGPCPRAEMEEVVLLGKSHCAVFFTVLSAGSSYSITVTSSISPHCSPSSQNSP